MQNKTLQEISLTTNHCLPTIEEARAEQCMDELFGWKLYDLGPIKYNYHSTWRIVTTIDVQNVETRWKWLNGLQTLADECETFVQQSGARVIINHKTQTYNSKSLNLDAGKLSIPVKSRVIALDSLRCNVIFFNKALKK